MDVRGITQIAKNVGGFVSQNSPTILTSMAVAGLITTTIFGIKATPKALDLIDERVWELYRGPDEEADETLSETIGVDLVNYTWKEKMDLLTTKEVIALTWKLYLPMIAMGTATVACIIGANHISLRRNAALASLYGITEAAFKEYRSKVVETFGKSKELKVRDDISGDQVRRNPIGMNEVIFTGKGEVICYDTLSGRYFKSDIEKVRRIINSLNYKLRSEIFITVNDLYYELGLSNTALGDQMGWDIDKGEITIDFSTQLTENGEPCLVLNYSVEPKFMR